MTNQEAIDNLRELREFAIGFLFEDNPEIVALDLAIKKRRKKNEEVD